MDRFVRNFIIVSIVYLGISSILGVCMLANQSLDVTEIRTFASEHARLGLDDDLRGWLSCPAEVLRQAAEISKDGGTAVLGSQHRVDRDAGFLYSEYLYADSDI